jgi:hypothetical protein
MKSLCEALPKRVGFNSIDYANKNTSSPSAGNAENCVQLLTLQNTFNPKFEYNKNFYLEQPTP